MPTLTDADKILRNDVGKRMADALEAIAEGSGGSAKIEEMTQAEYDQLTPAQKADGTLRAISDGETKIEDIDNVNITTSDNNKLLGVSVSGSDISVGAVDSFYLSNSSIYVDINASVTAGDTYTIPNDGLYYLRLAAVDTRAAEWSIYNRGIIGNSNLTTPFVISVFLRKGTILGTRNITGQTYSVLGYWTM